MKGTVLVLVALLVFAATVPMKALAQSPFEPITVGYLPSIPVLNPTTGYIYVANAGSGGQQGEDTVSVISGTTVVATVQNVELSDIGTEIVLAAGNIYVPVATGLVAISGESVLANLTSLTCGDSGYLGVDNATGVVFYVCGDHGSLIQGSTASIVQNEVNFTQPCGQGCNIPADLSDPVFDPSNGDMYISSGPYNQTLVTSGGPGTLVSVGQFPSVPGVDPSTGDVYVPNTGCEYSTVGLCSISVISGISVVATIPLTVEPGTPAYDPADGYMYIPEGCPNGAGYNCAIGVFSGTSPIATLTVHSDDCGGSNNCTPLVFDPTNGYMFVNDGNHVEWISGTSDLGLATPVPEGYSNAEYTPALDAQTNTLYESGGYNYVYAMSIPDLISSNELTTTSQSTVVATSNATSTTSSSSGGIPEFPYAPGVAVSFAALLVASYLLVRRVSRATRVPMRAS